MSGWTVRSIFVSMLRKFFNFKRDSEDIDFGEDNSTTGFINRKEGSTEECGTSNYQIEKSKCITHSKVPVGEDEGQQYTLLPGHLDLMDE